MEFVLSINSLRGSIMREAVMANISALREEIKQLEKVIRQKNKELRAKDAQIRHKDAEIEDFVKKQKRLMFLAKINGPL